MEIDDQSFTFLVFYVPTFDVDIIWCCNTDLVGL